MATWIDGPATAVEGQSMSSYLARTLLQGNADAVYEEARLDQTIIFPAYVDGDDDDYHGPFFVPIRAGRDGVWRTLSIDAICCGGTNSHDLTAYITPWYRAPRSSDPSVSWTVASGSTLAWQGSKDLVVDRSLLPRTMGFAGGDDAAEFVVAYLVFDFGQNAHGLTPHRFAGFRVRELS